MRQLLRGNLGFDGPIITDDLTMSGADSLGSIGERAIAAFKAGHDILLFGRDYDATIEAYECFLGAVQRREIDEAQLQASLDRVAGLKFKLERLISR